MPVRALAVRLGLAAGSVVVALFAAEIALRIAGVVPERFRAPRQVESPDKHHGIDAYPTNPRGYFDLDLRDEATRAIQTARGLRGLDAVARRTPYAVGFEYNDELCRDRPRTPRTPGVSRVLVLGDSFTEGEGVREADTFAVRIDRALKVVGENVEVWNCGRRGRDFPALYDAFERLVPAYEPDLVLYAMVLNDPEQSPAFRARQRFLNDWILDRRRMLGDDAGEGPGPWESRLWALASERLEAARVSRETRRWYEEMFAAPNADGWARTQEDLARMDREMRARGGRLLVALLPLMVDLEGPDPFPGATRAVREACVSRGIAFRDVRPALAGRPTATLVVHPVDLHPNERAHALIAVDLAPVVRGLLNRPGA